MSDTFILVNTAAAIIAIVLLIVKFRFSPAVALVLGACTHLASEPAEQPGAIRAMSFNIRLDIASDGPNAWTHRKQMVADVIRREEPALLGLQEVLLGPAVLGDGLAQDGRAGEEREDLAGHVAGEAHHLALRDMHPFGVGAGQAGDALEARLADLRG